MRTKTSHRVWEWLWGKFGRKLSENEGSAAAVLWIWSVLLKVLYVVSNINKLVNNSKLLEGVIVHSTTSLLYSFTLNHCVG